MLKNVTITLDEEDLRWARRQAAEKETSVSKLVGDIVRRERVRTGEYWETWKRLDKLSRKGLDIDAANRLTREEAHERRRR